MEANRIDISLPVIPPFKGNKETRLIVLGQDPTIKNQESRMNITCTLNLDKENALKKYIGYVCNRLGFTIDNVYATNLYKYFYSRPPAQTLHVLQAHLAPNIELLIRELFEYENIPVITLGEPVLQLLVNEKAKVRGYWDYDVKSGKSNGRFTFSKASENKLHRDFFPFPHQPSIRKEFYQKTIKDYLDFVKLQNTQN